MVARRATLAAAVVLGAVLAGRAAAPTAEPTATLEVSSRDAALGDPLDVRLTVEAGVTDVVQTLDLRSLDLGSVAVLDGAWAAPVESGGRRRWVWTGKIAGYELGSVQVPAIEIPVQLRDGARTVARTAAASLTLRGVLPEASPGTKGQELADLKPPATIPPDWGPLRKAMLGFAALAAVAASAWWLQRRYASGLKAVPAPDDPFRRLPPHVWVYEELGRLLERRLAESGQVDLFFEELSRILKTYLAGRYRVELLERTTDEVPSVLRQTGSPAAAIALAHALLAHCDLAKFARDVPDPAACRASVEDAYRIVDATKPADVERETQTAAAGAERT